MWDTSDHRDYALSATNPASSSKATVPGADWLALRGLSLIPVTPHGERTQTPGCGGRWRSGWFTWPPLWGAPLAASVTRSLLQAIPEDEEPSRTGEMAAWGVHRLYRSRITRSDQGGYGTFRPSGPVWSAAEEPGTARA